MSDRDFDLSEFKSERAEELLAPAFFDYERLLIHHTEEKRQIAVIPGSDLRFFEALEDRHDYAFAMRVLEEAVPDNDILWSSVKSKLGLK